MISIVTATVGRASLERVINNVDKQTYEDWEHVIVVDGVDLEDDMTASILAHPKRNVVYIQKTKNDHGKTPQNIGILAAKGEFVTLFDDDNEWLPDHLEKMIKGFAEPEVQIVFCPLTMIHYNSENRREERNFSLCCGKVDAGNWIARYEVFHRNGLFWGPQRRSYDWQWIKKVIENNEKYVVLENRTFLYYTPKL